MCKNVTPMGARRRAAGTRRPSHNRLSNRGTAEAGQGLVHCVECAYEEHADVVGTINILVAIRPSGGEEVN